MNKHTNKLINLKTNKRINREDKLKEKKIVKEMKK